jgi:hypothetical protein
MLKNWIETVWTDFSHNPELIAVASKFLTHLSSFWHHKGYALQVLTILTKVSSPSKKCLFCAQIPFFFFQYIEQKAEASITTIPLSPQNTLYARPLGTAFSILSLDTKELVQQMTLIEKELFGLIQPYELLGQAWNKQGSEFAAPNMVNFTQRFNKVGELLCNFQFLITFFSFHFFFR